MKALGFVGLVAAVLAAGDAAVAQEFEIRSAAPEVWARRDAIVRTVTNSAAEVASRVARLSSEGRTVSLAEFQDRVTVRNGQTVWDAALEAALESAQVVVFPPRDEPYYLDRTVVIPGGRRLVATGATVAKLPKSADAMFVNAGAVSGRFAPAVRGAPDRTICLEGGTWSSWCTGRIESPLSGRVCLNGEYQGDGGNAMMYFSNVDGLMMKDMRFVRSGSFAVQVGDSENLVFERIEFRDCNSDGIHVNGGIRRLLCRDISGRVGDDLVALNACDWENRSTLNWGPIEDVLCERIRAVGGCPWFRILPGVHRYSGADGKRNGLTADCPINRIVLRELSGISEIKMYLQPMMHAVGEMPDRDAVGTGRDWFIEDSEIELRGAWSPTGKLDEWGHVGSVELCSDVDGLHFRNLRLAGRPGESDFEHFLVIGPKSARSGDGKSEFFCPYYSCAVTNVTFDAVTVVSGVAPKRLVHTVTPARFPGAEPCSKSDGQ